LAAHPRRRFFSVFLEETALGREFLPLSFNISFFFFY